MNVHGMLNEEVIKWANVALGDKPAHSRIGLLEQLFREIQHPGVAAGHLDETVVERFFKELSEERRLEVETNI